VRSRIAAACASAGRSAGSVTLIAVSKTFGIEDIVPALDAGQRIFGENRVQEAKAKWPELRERYAGIELHLIGPLQTNKAREAVALADVIHTLDRPKLARVLADEIARAGRRPRLFVEVNTGEEEQKAGIAPKELEGFMKLCRDQCGLVIEGLMCIPPIEEEAGVHFAFLAKLAKDVGVTGLSMGMSADFEKAIAFGATHVRVGSAIFGSRPAAHA
jgi:hypothetical protein